MTPEQFVETLEKNYNLPDFLTALTPTPFAKNIFTHIPLTIHSDKPTMLIINGTTGSGKDTLMDALIQKGLVHKAVTGTSRKQREHELASTYVWFRKQHAAESAEEYYENLITEYDLVEHNVHHGNMYGLPQASLGLTAKKGIVVVRNEPTGAKSLYEKLHNDYTVCIVFVVPDSWQQILERVQKPGEIRDNIVTRLRDSVSMLEKSKDITHFYIHNTENVRQYTKNPETTGIHLMVDATATLLDNILSQQAL